MPQTYKQYHISHLERMLEISRNLNSTQNLETLLDSIIEASIELIQCEASSILLYDKDAEVLEFVASPSSQKADLLNLQVPLNNSIAGRVFTECQPVIIQSEKDTNIFRKIDQKLTFETRDLLAVPLLFKDEPIGVIEAVNKTNGEPFTTKDINTLEILASHAATAIQNTRLIEEIQLAYAELEQLELLKSNFISITSHELRTPIGLILGYAEMIKESTSDKDLKEKMRVIHKSALRLTKVVEDIDQMDQYQRGQSKLVKGSVKIDNLIENIIKKFSKKASTNNISLETKIKVKDLIIGGDKEKVFTILSNLVDNSLSFTPKGGRVLISIEKSSGYMKCSVIDNGIGIPANVIPRVFDRFFQVENHMTRKHEGIGLGLSVAKTLVELHNGEIWVQSVEGKGSNFTFLLPIGSKTASLENKLPPK